jgi:hypothetical protein
VRTTVDIEAQLLKRLRAEAARRGVSFKDLLQGLIRRGLDERQGTTTRYRGPSFAMGLPERGIPLDKALALAAALEDDEIARELRVRK